MEYLLSLGISLPSDVMVTQLEGLHPTPHLTIPFLLDKGGDIHTVAKNGNTLLHVAATKLYPEEYALGLTKHLVHAGCMPCVPNSLQETPLHVAARWGFISVIEYLLSLNITLPPDILLAASTGYPVDARVIHHLIQGGASVSVVTTNGDTPLHLVVLDSGVEDDCLECVKTLIDAGCEPRARNLAGKIPLHNAAMHGFCTVLEYLLSLRCSAA
ncbi:ankyrin repeat-containing domain protein [Butyriboletus roseoflavus]|nr:ankyrin repeat-containing domain protein [Butyriboletus roseoflavus]